MTQKKGQQPTKQPLTQWRAIIGVTRHFKLAHPHRSDAWAQPGRKETVSTKELEAWAGKQGLSFLIDKQYPIIYADQ